MFAETDSTGKSCRPAGNRSSVARCTATGGVAVYVTAITSVPAVAELQLPAISCCLGDAQLRVLAPAEHLLC